MRLNLCKLCMASAVTGPLLPLQLLSKVQGDHCVRERGASRTQLCDWPAKTALDAQDECLTLLTLIKLSRRYEPLFQIIHSLLAMRVFFFFF